MRRVVITGIGAVTPLGNDMNSTWENIIQRRSGIGRITKFDTSNLPSRIAGELKDFGPGMFMPAKDILRLDPFVHYAAAAGLMACKDAGLTDSAAENGTGLCRGVLQYAPTVGVIIGSSRGGVTSMEKALERHLVQRKPFSAYLMSASTINMASAYISMRLGIRGPALGVSTACASGSTAIGEAFRMIRHGDIDVAFAGGAEAPVCRLAVGGYGASGALSVRNNEPEKASRPFDRDRDGFIVAEGACVLVLEELEHALKRDAFVYAELAGYGTSSDAFHQTKPDSKGESESIRKALKDANITADNVDYINAHATSTSLGDSAEAMAIKEVFGARAADIHVSSCKSMLGHMLGASGALEAAITAMSIKKDLITPTINLDNPDEALGLNIATSTISGRINTAVSNSFGFGGINAVLVLKKFSRD
ncbi:MAG: beta-ketoacyl-[acyl-carrier-protein] synthase II [Nitrospirota bacterium]